MDAFQQPNLENSSSANPQSIHQHHREKREYPYPLFIQDSEAHHHKNQPLLPQGRQAKGGDILTKETCHKDGKDSTFQDQATLFPKSEAKGRGESCHSKALPVNPRLPNQESSLE